MYIVIGCGKCEAHFGISSNFKNKEPLVCQNCGCPLPGKMSEHIKSFFDAYNLLSDDVQTNCDYCITFSENKLIG